MATEAAVHDKYPTHHEQALFYRNLHVELMKKGTVTVHFYETQVWEDFFPKITLGHYEFTVK